MNVKHTLIALLVAAATVAVAGSSTSTPAALPALQAGKLPVAVHYPGGHDSLVAHINRSIQYPAMAKRNRVMGQCIVGFVLNEDGSISNIKLLKEIGGGLGQEALRVVQLLKFNAPGYSQQYSVPVNFKL